MPTQYLLSVRDSEDYMSTIAFDEFALTRIADFARSLSRLHQASRRQVVDETGHSIEPPRDGSRIGERRR